MEEFVNDTIPYIGQYFLRNNSESGFSADKRNFIIWDKPIKHGDLHETTNIKVGDEYYFITVSSTRYSFMQTLTI
ncbi:Uncharacterised protein [uncultured archaeon]|nr:Uncharacterised protein [uncultured archaeon]